MQAGITRGVLPPEGGVLPAVEPLRACREDETRTSTGTTTTTRTTMTTTEKSISMKMTIATAFIAALQFVHAAQAQQASSGPSARCCRSRTWGATGREATMQIVEFAQGAAEVPHTHPGELIGYVLEGAFELDVAGKSTATHRAGDSFLIEGGRVHAAKNIAPGRAECWPPSFSKRPAAQLAGEVGRRCRGTLPYSGWIPAAAQHFRIFFELGLDEQSEFGGCAPDGL